MKTSSYLYMSNRKNILSTRKMDKRSSKSNNMSADSLQDDFKKKTSLVDTISDENVETVVVPFYEKDVRIKVPKEIRHVKPDNKKSVNKHNKDQHPSSYLVNKQSKRSSTYLEKFRNHFFPNYVDNKHDGPEIRSISPEVGDTDRENLSFGDEEQNNPVEEFTNTEAYNEIYYENLIQREAANYSDNSSDEALCINDDLNSKSPDDDNLRSVSEVTQPRRCLRRLTVEPVVNVKLGGLGPDLEMIRPQLMRARSLQRYSDKVRAANRVSIYKKTVTETSKQNKKECEFKVLEKKPTQNTPRRCVAEEQVSYLVNKSSEKTVKMTRKSQNKSANPNKKCEVVATEEHSKSKASCKKNTAEKKCQKKPEHDGAGEKNTGNAVEVKVKSSSRSKTIKTEIKPKTNDVPPIHISFLVNVENSSGNALRSLEEKHRRYQEMVKQYVNDYS